MKQFNFQFYYLLRGFERYRMLQHVMHSKTNVSVEVSWSHSHSSVAFRMTTKYEARILPLSFRNVNIVCALLHIAMHNILLLLRALREN